MAVVWYGGALHIDSSGEVLFFKSLAAFRKLGVFNKTLEDANARVLLEFNGGRVVFAVALS